MINSLATELHNAFLGFSPVARGLFIAWIVEMISVPIVKWIWGERAMRQAIVLGVLLQASTVFALLWQAWGLPRALLAAVAVVALGWLVEFIGSRTAWPFGPYHYTDRLQPQVGRVPVVIPLAWLMMLPPAWAVGERITGTPRATLPFVIVSALAIMVWDFFLDPQMVKWGFWEWRRHGGYFGIPWQNFAGWFVAAALMTWIIAPGPLPTSPLLMIYSVTWLLQTIGQAAFWKLPGPALVGFLAMGAAVVLGWFL